MLKCYLFNALKKLYFKVFTVFKNKEKLSKNYVKFADKLVLSYFVVTKNNYVKN